MGDDYRGTCDYAPCEKEQIRHFASYHFCNQHNRMLRREAQIEKPDDLWAWVEDKT